MAGSIKSICAQCRKEYKDSQLELISIKDKQFFACEACIKQLSKI
jgi:hypothetical protein